MVDQIINSSNIAAFYDDIKVIAELGGIGYIGAILPGLECKVFELASKKVKVINGQIVKKGEKFDKLL